MSGTSIVLVVVAVLATLALAAIVFLNFFALDRLLKFLGRDQPVDDSKPQSQDADRKEAPRSVLKSLTFDDFFRHLIADLRALTSSRASIYRIPWVLMLVDEDTDVAHVFEGSGLEGGGRRRTADGAVSAWILSTCVVLAVSEKEFSGASLRWRRLLRALAKARAERPLDALVIARAASRLDEAGGDDPGLTRRVMTLRRTLGMRLPCYVLLTRGEALGGLVDVGRSLDDRLGASMLGWSNPLPVESAFDPDWVDRAVSRIVDAFRLLRIRAQGRLAELSDAAEGVLALGRLGHKPAALRAQLTPLFRTRSYADPLILRGIYLCASSEDDGRPLFVKDLFEQKISPEAGLARRGSMGGTFRPGMFRTLQGACAAALVFVLVTALLGWFALGDLRESIFDQHKQLQAGMVGLYEAVRRNDETTQPQRANALLQALAAGPRVPASVKTFPRQWFSGFRHQINSASELAFRWLVLDAVPLGMHDRLGEIIGGEDAAPPPALTPPRDAVCRDALTGLAGSYFHFNAWLEHERIFSTLTGPKPDRRSQAGRAGAVLSYAFAVADPPADVLALGREDLSAHKRRSFNPELMNPASDAIDDALALRVSALEGCLSGVAEIVRLASVIQDQLGLMTAVATRARSRNLALGHVDALGRLADSVPLLEQALARLEDAPQRVESLLASPVADGIRELLKAENFSRIDDPRLLDFAAIARDALTDADKKLEAEVASRYSDVIVANGGTFTVAPDVSQLSTGIAGLLVRPFMSLRPDSTVPDRVDTSFEWYLPRLAEAGAAASDYLGFADDQLKEFPDAYRADIQAIARQQAEQRLSLQLLTAIQPLKLGLDGSPRARLTARLGNFRRAAENLKSILAITQQVRFEYAESIIADQIRRQSEAVFDQVEALLAENAVYLPRGRGFASAAELDTYLGDQLQEISQVADDFVQPLVDFLALPEARSAIEPSARRRAWQVTLKEIQQADQGAGDSAVAKLDEYIRTLHPPGEASPDCASADPGGAPSSFFDQRRNDLAALARQECGDQLRQAIDDSYAPIAAEFSRLLAGRFPFAERDNLDAQAASLPAVQSFFKTYDTRRERLTELLASAAKQEDPDPGPDIESIQGFVKQLDGVRQFFSPWLDGELNGPPGWLVDATFRVPRGTPDSARNYANQVLDWELRLTETTAKSLRESAGIWRTGSPALVAFRWAANAEFEPLPGAWYTLDRERERIVHSSDDRWSLLRMISRFESLQSRLNNEDPEYAEGHVLEFKVALLERSEEGESRSVGAADALITLGIRLAPLTAGEPTLPPVGGSMPEFPAAAPALSNEDRSVS